MTYDIYFEAELANHETQYFILDTKGGGKHGDIDFLRYDWSPSRYTLVKEDDVFLYLRPRDDSGTRIFFGAAKIGPIFGKERLTSKLIKPYPFKNHIYANDLESFRWTWKVDQAQGNLLPGHRKNSPPNPPTIIQFAHESNRLNL